MSVCKNCNGTTIDYGDEQPECMMCGSSDIKVMTNKEYPEVECLTAHATYPCKWCGEEILPTHPIYWRKKGNRYCSDACMDEWFYFQDLKKKGIVAISRSEFKCAVCDQLMPFGWYHWYTTNKKFCSQKCFDARPRKISQGIGPGTCANESCGKEFQKRSPTHKYCSPHCSRVAASKTWRENPGDKSVETKEKQIDDLHKSMAQSET